MVHRIGSWDRPDATQHAPSSRHPRAFRPPRNGKPPDECSVLLLARRTARARELIGPDLPRVEAPDGRQHLVDRLVEVRGLASETQWIDARDNKRLEVRA